MDSTLGGPIIVHVSTKVLSFLRNQESINGLMPTAPDLHGCVSVGACQRMDAVERFLVKPKYYVRPQTKWPLVILDVIANYFDRQIVLADAILCLPASFLFWVGYKLKLLGDAMPIASHGMLLLSFQFAIYLGNHFASDVLVLDVRVAVNETLPLLAKLRRGHLDGQSPFYEHFKLFRHDLSRLSFPHES